MGQHRCKSSGMAWPACPWGRVWTQIRAAAIVMFLFAHKSIATDCNFLQGCQSCSTQQPQLRAPILPGYKGTPISTSRQAQITAKYSQEVDPKTRLPVTAASDTDTQPEAAGTLQPVAADSSSPSRKARVLLRDARTEASALYVSQATQAESQISGYSLSDAVHTNMQQSKPPANSVATVASAAATGASAAEISSDSPRIVHAADATGPTVVGPAMGPSPVPLVLAPPALDAVRSNEDHPVYPAAADQQSQALSILTADPKASGPHPWDVLLFKTNQFNTTRPAYRLGGLGLMLMADFNKSRPLTDWHAVAVQPQQQQQQQQVNVKSTFNKASSDSSSGQGHGVLGQLGQMMKQAVQNNGKPAAAVHLEAGQILKPPSLVEQLKSILQKLGKAKTNASADKDAVFSIASVDGPKRLWCTACESPAYRLSEFGTCVCSPGYGRLLDSKNPYACVACPAGYISSNGSVSMSQQHTGPTDIRLQPSISTDLGSQHASEASGSMLGICQACPRGAQASQDQTACVAPSDNTQGTR